MWENILVLIWISISALIPILFWGYTFSYIDSSLANRTRFILWVIAWMVSVIPVIYLDYILGVLSLENWSVFYWAYHFWGINSLLWFNGSLYVLLFCIFWVAFITGLQTFSQKKWLLLLKNIGVFSASFFILSLFFIGVQYFFKIYPEMNFQMDQVGFWPLVFNSLKLVIFYYLLISLLEESSKHFHFLNAWILQINSVKQGVLYAIFIALWFSFVENILYFYWLYSQEWLHFWLLKIYFYRSTFALIVHVLCSSVLAYYFSAAYISWKKFLSFWFLQPFLWGIFASILLHAIFDISLSLWFSLIMFLYFIWGYLYVTSIFYKDTEITS